MIQGSIIFGVGLAAGIVGLAWYSYYKGERVCAPSYEAKILKAQAKNREIALAYYQSAAAKAKELSDKSEAKEAETKVKYDKLKAEVDNLPTVVDDAFIDGEFLRQLSGVRQ